MKKLLIAGLATGLVMLTLAAASQAAMPKNNTGWAKLEAKVMGLYDASSAGGCEGSITKAMKVHVAALSEDYNQTSKKLDETMLTARPIWLPSKAPSLDSMRKWACYGGKAPKIDVRYRWGWPYQQYLYLVELAQRSCAGENVNLKYGHSAGEYNLHAYRGDDVWPKGLPARAPKLVDLMKATC